MHFLQLFGRLLMGGALMAQPPGEHPVNSPVQPNTVPSSIQNEVQIQGGHMAPGANSPASTDHQSFKKPHPSEAPKQSPGPLVSPKDTLKPGTIYSPKKINYSMQEVSG